MAAIPATRVAGDYPGAPSSPWLDHDAQLSDHRFGASSIVTLIRQLCDMLHCLQISVTLMMMFSVLLTPCPGCMEANLN